MKPELVGYVDYIFELDMYDLYEDFKMVKDGAKVAFLEGVKSAPTERVIVIYTGKASIDELKVMYEKAVNE